MRRYTRPVFNLLDPTQQWVATICTDRGVITMKLRAKDSPQATANFAFLARAGFYDGLSFHRVCPNKSDPSCGGTLAIAQGGDPKGDGSGGPGYNIKDEVPVGGYTAGTVAMAKTSAPNSAGSQFFIDTGDNSFPPNYAIFGDITFGLDVAKLLKKGDHIVWIDVSLASAPSPSAQPLLPGAPTPSPTPAASPS